MRPSPGEAVAEIYSPPRVTMWAKALPHFGIIPGFAMDLTTEDEHGVAWDFSIKELISLLLERFVTRETILYIRIC